MKKNNKGITLIALIITIIVLLILAGVTISTISGNENTMGKANEASQKNDISTAKDEISLIAINSKTQAMGTAYVEGTVAPQDASTSVGQAVINAVLEKDGINNGKVSIEVVQAVNNGVKDNATIEITTKDFIVEGTITIQDGVLTWGEIEENLPFRTMKAKDFLPKSTNSTESPYVIYKADKNIDDTTNGETNEILCRVLYNDDDTHGLQLIAVNPVTDVKLGKTDPKATAAIESNGKNYANNTSLKEREIALNSYNNAIIYLNEYSEEYRNKTDGIAIDSRCVGSLATVKKNTSGVITGFDKKNNPDDLVENIDNPTEEEKSLYMYNANNMGDYNGKLFNTDSNYTEDENRLKASGGIDAYKFTKKADGSAATSSDYYWLASRNVLVRYSIMYFFNVRCESTGGENSARKGLINIVNGGIGTSPDEMESGFRPIFLLDSNVKLTGTGENLGSESNPYRLKK